MARQVTGIRPHSAWFTVILPFLGISCGTSTVPTTPGGSTVVVSWMPSSAADVVVYRVYIGERARDYLRSEVVVAPADSLSLRDLESGKTYYFAVTAVDGAGNESALSEEVSLDLSSG